MLSYSNHHDEELINHVLSVSKDTDEFWSFKGNSQREYGHGLLQYPAMMVPQMVRVILDICCKVHPELNSVGDPFVGSGTVLTESMLKGLNFWGTDINPLSILACEVKKGPFHSEQLKMKSIRLLNDIIHDANENVDIFFNGIDKWFEHKHQTGLSRIRRNILKENDLWARRFFWLTLAETVRYTSNSRTSTFKLHIRTSEDIKSRVFNVVDVFKKHLDRNFNLFLSLENYLEYNNLLNDCVYRKGVELSISDIRTSNNTFKSDLIITSPPYGDNQTTVPYGQYSYLPLQWVNLSDIDESLSAEILRTTHNIDSHSIGGKHNKLTTVNQLCDCSSALANYLSKIEDMPPDRTARVTSFFNDFNISIPQILSRLNPNGLMIFVLGNRKVGGKRVPFDQILIELMGCNNVKLVHHLRRSIPSKRMASKNSFSETMSKESIIILRKS